MPKPDAMSELVGSLLALRHVAGELERKAGDVIWHAPDARRTAVIDCVIEKIAQCMTEIEKCRAATRPTLREEAEAPDPGGQGPRCRGGFHEEFGICVPDQ
jgi:hypothetical protein